MTDGQPDVPPGESDVVTLAVVGIRPETRDVKTFVFRAEGGPLTYQAGQSMTLKLVLGSDTVFRTFSLASAPSGGEELAMTIKAHENGRATRWMHDVLAVGDRLEARTPRGRFTIASRTSDRIALVSAGSGASPLMAMLRHLAWTAPETDIAWLHAARTPRDLLFAPELAELQRTMPRLNVAMVAGRPEPGWFGFTGRLTRRLVSVAAPDFGRREVFCCGPAGFMELARLIHAAEGGRGEVFHIEHFGAVAPPPVAATDPSEPGEAFTIRLDGREFAARSDETLLQAATRQNVVIPCGCASGLCGTCRISLVEGEIAMRHEGGISAEEEAQGFILACSSRPRSDLVLSS